MGEERELVRLSVNVPKSDKEAAMAKTEHGEISEKVRELLAGIAEGGTSEVSPRSISWTAPHAGRLEESNDYPNDWGKRRKDTFLRDNYVCQNCGDRGGRDGPKELRAHHVVPAKKGGSHYLSNLQTLCRECHDNIHGVKPQDE